MVDSEVIQRQISEVAERLKTTRAELARVDEELLAAQDEAQDARLRGLLAETPGAVAEAHDAARRVDLLAQARASVVRSLDDLVAEQDALLDRLGSES